MGKTAGVEVVYRGRKITMSSWREAGVQIFCKKMTASMFDIGFDFLFLFPVSSWAKKRCLGVCQCAG